MTLQPTALLCCALTFGTASIACADAVTDPLPPALVSSFTADTHFTVRASRFFFWADRRVSVHGTLRGLSGELNIALDKPVRAVLGIRVVLIHVRVFDDVGREVTNPIGRLEDGDVGCTIPLVFDRPGRYHLVLNDTDLVAGAAKMRVLPAGSARMELVATEPLPGPSTPRFAPGGFSESGRRRISGDLSKAGPGSGPGVSAGAWRRPMR